MILGASNKAGPPISRLRPGSRLDSYGDPVEDWLVPIVTPLRSAEVQSPSSTEYETPTSDQLQNERTLFSPGALDLTAADRISVGAEVWRVDGDPVVRHSLASGIYTTARLRRGVSA